MVVVVWLRMVWLRFKVIILIRCCFGYRCDLRVGRLSVLVVELLVGCCF